EPYSFISGAPFNFESYPWAPLGDGWQLNFPWLSNVANPSFIHLWSGEGYEIPSSFWTVSPYFENHQGEHFTMLRNNTGIFLTVKSGTVYRFDVGHSNRLASETDTLGNTISFTYDQNNRINCVVDIVGRNFQLSYTNSYLTSISQFTGTCANPGQTVRTVSFTQSNGSLGSVSDPAHRQTFFQYNAVNDPNIAPWLISQITYPTGWYTSYSYAPAPLGTQATSYRTFTQTVYSSPYISTIRKYQYNYTNSGGDQITGATIRAYNGTSLSSYTDYAFSFAGMTMNVSDSNHLLVRGEQQVFGVHGEVPRQITIFANDGYCCTSLTDYYRY
ncbi:hypothetical protein J2P12_08945, partial [Candidatus Bathyarchaeota archaeon]|nr:hypothetical protein [Candidatus Bathyarchaeota archaeon]